MTVVHALAILEAATLECKKREINTRGSERGSGFFGAVYSAALADSAVTMSLTPWEIPWLIGKVNNRCFTEASGVSARRSESYLRMNRLVREFATVRDPKVKEEIDQLS